MVDEGWVSVWIGRADTRAALDSALEVQHGGAAEDDFRGSAFSRAFDLGWYDSHWVAAEVQATPLASLRAPLLEFPDGRVFADRVLAVAPALWPSDNAIVVLYDYRYEGVHREWETGHVRLRFAGAVRST